MLVESLLPLGKLDPGLREPENPLDIRDFATEASLAERVGLDAVLVEETKDDPFQLLALAATITGRIQLGTSVAMAFSPQPHRDRALSLVAAKLSEGRFVLGLGTQVRAHIERRYGVSWSAPAPRMRDYVTALRAVWGSWQTGERLSVATEHYTLDLMVPLFDPGPIDHPDIPIHLSAIGPNMCALAGEVADGIRLHPVCSPQFIDEAVMPALTRGAIRTKRLPDDIEICLKPLIATAADDESLARVAEVVRARVAFYLSTPSYRRAFEIHDWGEIARRASELARAKRWDELPDLVDRRMLHTMATVGTYDEIADRLVERYGPRVDRLEFSIPVVDDDDVEILASILDRLHACPPRTEAGSPSVGTPGDESPSS